jgi:hypothetical protein
MGRIDESVADDGVASGDEDDVVARTAVEVVLALDVVEGNKFSRDDDDDDDEGKSTVKGWPQEEDVDCEDERPRRERSVVVWRDLRILNGCMWEL